METVLEETILLKEKPYTFTDSILLFKDMYEKYHGYEWEGKVLDRLGYLVSLSLYKPGETYETDKLNQVDPNQLKEILANAFISRTPLVDLDTLQDYFGDSTFDLSDVDKTCLMLKELKKHVAHSPSRVANVIEGLIDNQASFEWYQQRQSIADILSALMHDSFITNHKDKSLFETLNELTPFFDFNRMVPIWEDRLKNQELPMKTIGMDIRQIMELESVSPGYTIRLIEEHGIFCIGRYNTYLLQKQIEQKDDASPYGLLISSASDWNGALHTGAYWSSHIHEQVERRGYNLRIIETDNSFGLARAILKLDKKFGHENKISFAFGNTHGKEESIQLGGKENILSLNDLEVLDDSRIKDAFVENPQIIMISCLVGKKGGFAQKLSEKLQAKVYAADKVINSHNILITGDKHKKIEIKFSYLTDSDSDKSHYARIYQSGKLINAGYREPA